MAKRTRSGTKFVNKQRGLTIFVAVFISFSLIASSLFGLFGGIGATVSSPGTTNTTTPTPDTKSLENTVKTLVDQVYSNPDDSALKESLGLSYFNLGDAYMKNNDPKAQEAFKNSISTFNEVLKKSPDNKAVLGDLATAYYYSGQVDQAIASVEKALAIDPNFAPARMNYGIYLGLGKMDYDKAIKELQKISADNAQYSQAQSMIEQFKQQKANPTPTAPSTGTTTGSAYSNNTVSDSTYKQ